MLVVGGSSIQQKQLVLITTSARFIVSHSKLIVLEGGRSVADLQCVPEDEGKGKQIPNHRATTHSPGTEQTNRISELQCQNMTSISMKKIFSSPFCQFGTLNYLSGNVGCVGQNTLQC